MKIEYLLFNFFVAIFPLVSAIVYKRTKKPLVLPAIISLLISAIIFISWDIAVTDYFWNFNQNYILGIKFIRIPLEEMLFFFTVPFACLFLYVNFTQLFKSEKILNRNLILEIISVIFFLSGCFFILKKYYTALVFLYLVVIWFFDLFLLKTKLTTKVVYWYFMAIVFLLTFIFNYYLTKRPVVIYNDSVNLNIRLLTIPVEDFIYGISLITTVLVLYHFFANNFSYKKN
jgi:lycopene cyclase domain-containing protein